MKFLESLGWHPSNGKRFRAKDFGRMASALDAFPAKISFSQAGEDVIMNFVFQAMGIGAPTYIDIGAFEPYKYSNTALFYLQGSRGVTVEPNPANIGKFIEMRPEDTNLNIGISNVTGEVDYYIFDAPTLNTCSKKEAAIFQEQGNHKILNVTKVKVDTLQNVIQDHCGGIFPDLLSLDAEGVDEIVLQAIDYEKNCPKVVCVETISFSDTINLSENGGDVKNKEVIDFLLSKGYVLYADTYINSIFVKKKCFAN